MSDTLYGRDAAAIAGVQKLRFFPLTVTAGQGSELIDETGRRLLDLSASWGAASLGYGDPDLVEAVSAAVRGQAGASILSAVTRPAVELAERLLAKTPAPNQDERRVWLGHSGSDANEAALRSIMAATGRRRIISFVGAYHGGTAGSMSISGHSAQAGAPKHPGALFLPYPDPYRPFMGDASGQAVLDLLDYHFSADCPPEDVACLFFEPIMSDGGLIVPPPGFLAALAERCRKHDILIVSDEVKVGCARSGLFHCVQHEGFMPDVIVMGKGLGGGLPLSAVIGPSSVLDVAQAFALETTCGNPVSASAGLTVLAAIENRDLCGHAERLGQCLRQGLEELAGRHELIGDVRGRGLALGVELVADRESRRPARQETALCVYRAWELGLVVYYVGLGSNVLELTPPLVMKPEEADRAVAVLDQALTDVAAGRVDPEKAAAFAGW